MSPLERIDPAASSLARSPLMASRELPPMNPDLMSRLWRRYRYGLLLLVVGAMAGAACEYGFVTPLYRSSGSLRISPTGTSERSAASFDLAFNTQLALIRSRPVIAAAMASDAWKAARQNKPAITAEQFRKSLEFCQPGATGEIVTLSYNDADPATAKAGVSSLMLAYRAANDDANRIATDFSLKTTQDYAADLQSQQEALEKTIAGIAGPLGAPNLETQFQQANQDFAAIRQRIAQLDAAVPMDSDDPAVMQKLNTGDVNLTHQIADRTARQTELDQLAASLGSQHPALAKLHDEIAAIDLSIETQVYGHGGVVQTARAGASPAMEMRLKSDVADERKILASRAADDAKAAADLDSRLQQLREPRQAIAAITPRLAQANQSLETLQFAAKTQANPITFLSIGEEPELPSRYTTLMRLGYGGLLGGASAFGLLIVLVMTDFRLLSPQDVRGRSSSVPVLGIVPQIGGRRAGEQSADAWKSIYQLRSQIQIWQAARDHHVFAVTSATPGSGKTAVTAALGVAFTTSHAKTLLIDCHCGRPDLTRIVNECLAMDDDLPPLDPSLGLSGVLDGEALMDCVLPVGLPGLFVLPIDLHASANPGALSLASIRKIIALAREQFDMVLIDTGTLASTPEAMLVAEAADGVLMVVSHGDTESSVSQTLRCAGHHQVGMIYNRARSSETPKASTGRDEQTRLRLESAMSAGDAESLRRFGPLGPVAAAVARQAMRAAA